MKKAIIFFGLIFAVRAQAPVTIVPQPGDVVYTDNTTERPYLWFHGSTKTYEVIAPYTQDQVFKLLLDREQSCWTTVYWLNRSTSVTQGLQASRAQ